MIFELWHSVIKLWLLEHSVNSICLSRGTKETILIMPYAKKNAVGITINLTTKNLPKEIGLFFSINQNSINASENYSNHHNQAAACRMYLCFQKSGDQAPSQCLLIHWIMEEDEPHTKQLQVQCPLQTNSHCTTWSADKAQVLKM